MSVLTPPSPTRAASDRWLYRVAGVHISADLQLHDLHPAGVPLSEATGGIAIEECAPQDLPELGPLLREIADEDGRFAFRTYQVGEGLLWSVQNIGDFFVHGGGARISYLTNPLALESDIEHVILGPILGSAFQLRGLPLVHAGAVVHEGAAIAVSAPSGYGKSTLIAQLAALGLPVLTDDTLPVTLAGAAAVVEPYIPRMKLWDDALEALGHDPASHRTALSWLDKRRVPLDGGIASIAEGRYPLRRIYLLSPRAAGSPIAFRQLDGHEAVLSLMAAMYLPELLRGRRAAPAFRAATAIAAASAVRSVSYPRTFEDLPALARAIIQDASAR